MGVAPIISRTQSGSAIYDLALVARNILERERMHFNLELAVAKYLIAPASESA